jgi:translation elongation factor EF-Ts
MDIVVTRTLLHKSPAERARILGNIQKYVHNNNFINIVANLDVNDPKQIARVCQQLAAFNSLVPLWDEVELWLRC